VRRVNWIEDISVAFSANTVSCKLARHMIKNHHKLQTPLSKAKSSLFDLPAEFTPDCGYKIAPPNAKK